MKKILDPCCGAKMMFLDKNDERVVFCDKRNEVVELPDRQLHITPDLQADFRNLPFSDEEFYLVSFDPPHLLRAGKKSWLRAKYGILDKASWQEDLKRGFDECWRVLKPNGTLVFKWNEDQVKISEVLKLLPQKPVFGHLSGRKGLTHWLVFFKG